MSGKLVVPLDGSDLGEAALPWATFLARSQELTPVLTRVVAWPAVLPGDGLGGYIPPETFDEILNAERDVAREYLAGIKDRLAAEGVQAEIEVREGLAADGVMDLADETGAYAVVMSTHGRGGLTRVLLGSIAERVLRQAHIPVLMVHARPDGKPETPTLRRVLVTLDGSPFAERALEVARSLVTTDTTLVLMRVVTPLERSMPSEGTTIKVVDEQATTKAMSDAEGYLAGLKQSLGSNHSAIQTIVLAGDPAEEIVAVAAEQHIDLVVMTTHGRTGPQRWWMGSVADEVLRRAERPVFLLSARAVAARVAGPYAVRDIMTRDLATVYEDESLVVALRKLLRRRVSGMPVVNEKEELVGIISEHDLLTWQGTLLEKLAKESELSPEDYGRRLAKETVRKLMSHPPITIDEGASLAEAVRVLQQRELRRLPVTRDGRLVGIITRHDVLKAMAAQWETTAGLSEG